MAEVDIHMVVTDLDDTLLSPKKEISDEAVKKIGVLKDRGIHFTFITGRPPYAVERFARRVGLNAPMVCCNGAMLVRDGQILEQDSFALAPLKDLMEEMANLGMTVLLFDGEIEYILVKTHWAKGRNVPIWPGGRERWENGEGVKIAVMAGNETEEFSRFVPKLQTLDKDYSIFLYGKTGCEIVAKGMNKAVGLRKLSRLMKIDAKNVLAVGDNENDMEMLKAAGIGAAVANAVDSTKAVADYVCQGSYTTGVLEAIDRFVLRQRTKAQ